MPYCATCNNTGYIDCHCGGDLCVCGEEEIECPECGGMIGFDDDEELDAATTDLEQQYPKTLAHLAGKPQSSR